MTKNIRWVFWKSRAYVQSSEPPKETRQNIILIGWKIENSVDVDQYAHILNWEVA